MTTPRHGTGGPGGPTAESEALLDRYAAAPYARTTEANKAMAAKRRANMAEMARAIEAAAVARHVRETGCEGLREALEERVAEGLSRYWIKAGVGHDSVNYRDEARRLLGEPR